MNKLINSLLFCLIPFTAFCNTDDSVKAEKIQVGALYAPNYCYRTLKSTADASWLSDNRNSSEIPKFGFNAGLTLRYRIATRVSIGFEIVFSDKGEKTKKYPLENSLTTNEALKAPTAISYKYHYQYLDMPVKVNYLLCTGKTSFFITAGISVNAFINRTTGITTSYDDGSETKTKSIQHPKFEKINFAVLGGFGMNYDLTAKYTLRVEPIYERSLNAISNTPVKSYLYALGINFGIAYKL